MVIQDTTAAAAAATTTTTMTTTAAADAIETCVVRVQACLQRDIPCLDGPARLAAKAACYAEFQACINKSVAATVVSSSSSSSSSTQ